MNVVKVRLRKPRRVFSFSCTELALQRDEPCIVLSDRGEEFGTCILPPEPCPQDMEKRFSMKVLRKVTDKDERSRAYLEEEERRAREICLKKIKDRRLPMKMVDVEVTFDKRKVIFYFTADDRVDFRELVRDLAHDLRARIEMRHIQVRDEAKMVGGLGGCGRELCCSSWMNEFRPISMRMAKAQNLSLNPSKISGQCGRLLCCLSYENDQYEAMRKKARQEAKERQAKIESRPKQDEGDRKASAEESRSEDGRRQKDSSGNRSEAPPSRGARGRGRRDERDNRSDSQKTTGGESEERKETPQQSAEGSAPDSDTAPSSGAAPASADGGEKKPARRRRNRKRKRGPRGGGKGEGSGGGGGQS
jgi:cell fate regulator YaaT (PSP1 superfamily)